MAFFLGQVVHAYLLLRERDFLRLPQVVDLVMLDCSTNFILERNSFFHESYSCNMWISSPSLFPTRERATRA